MFQNLLTWLRLRPKPVIPATMLPIIDVSKHNGIIDWKAVAPHISGAILKATEGATVMDKQFYDNVRGCEANNIPWGAYHFATWNDEDEVRDATNEARFFLSVVNGASGIPKLPLVLDIESNKPIPYTKQEMVVYCKTFLSFIPIQYDKAIYGSPGFLNSYLPPNHPFKDIKLWVADYTGDINPVPGWEKPWLRQYTDKGNVKGMSGYVDLNRLV